MTKAIPQIRKFMSVQPITLQASAKLSECYALMREKHIRHLPVCEGEKIVGLVSDGDLLRATSLTGADATKSTVRDVMVAKPYTVSPDAPVDEVVREMAGHKYGSAVVLDNGHVVGMFTAIDAMSAFAELLQTRLR
ncbi:MAG: CBS domain-containing protein [Archangium sp.]|nr:CBS domain-containing protein [Archangium sp.]